MWHLDLHSNMNFLPPASILGFMAACAGLALSTLAIVVACFVRKLRVAQLLFKITALGAMAYVVLLLTFAWASHDYVLTPGQEKYFCEIDCHLAYSVVQVKTEPAGRGQTYTITLRTRFDETTISPQRPKDAPLTPNPRRVELIDARGERWPLSTSTGVALTTPLRPGDTYLTELLFQVPAQAHGLRLLLTSNGWPERLLIGDEQSPFHAKTWFAL